MEQLLIVNPRIDPDWTKRLPAGYSVQLRIDSKIIKPRELPSGKIKYCTDLQWYLGGGFVPESIGTALKFVGPDGNEVLPNIFRNSARA